MRALVFLLASATLLPALNFPMSWRYAHPDAKAMAGVDVRELMLSPLGAAIRGQLWTSPLKDVAGLEMIDDIDRVVISSPGKRGPKDKQAPFVAVLSGRFQLDRLRRMATDEGTVVRHYKGVEIVAPPKAQDGDPHFALIDAQTILAGDRRSVMAAIERGRGLQEIPPPGPLMVRAREMAYQNSIWIVARIPPAELGDVKAAATASGMDVEGFDLGVSLKNGANVNLNLATKSEESAHALVGTLRMFSTMALQQAKAPVVDLLKQLDIQQDESGVTITLAVSKDAMEKAAVELASALRPKKPQQTPQLAALAPTEPRNEPSQKRVVRIVGLDDGPREIPFPE